MDHPSQLRRFGVFDANVPRYTSYPPTPCFANNVQPREFGRWVSEIPDGTGVSIYLHIPFCQRLCWFCAARTQSVGCGASVSAYVDTLIQEINTLRAAMPHQVWAERIFWGGGTPTILPPNDILRLGKALSDSFPSADSTEITVEIDPTEIDAVRMDALAAMGMTNASLGIQDFDPEIQRAIGRELSFVTTKKAVDGLRGRGVGTLSTSLLYGLPNQTQSRLLTSAQMLLSLSPDKIAVQPYAHAPSIARRQSLIPTDRIPSPEVRLQLFEATQQMLTWDGYHEIGIDHFALRSDRLAAASQAGTLRRGFEGYNDAEGDILLGLGASAVSRLPQGYTQNAPSTDAYIKAVQAGGFAMANGHKITPQDALRGRMIEMILCDFAINTDRLAQEGFAQEGQISALLDQLLRHFAGQIVRTPDGLAIPTPAKPLARVIARDLDTYIDAAKGQQSPA